MNSVDIDSLGNIIVHPRVLSTSGQSHLTYNCRLER